MLNFSLAGGGLRIFQSLFVFCFNYIVACFADGGATTLQGADVEVTSRTFRFWGWRFPYSIVSVNGNRVIAADITTDNGVIHLITGVLLPPSGE